MTRTKGLAAAFYLAAVLVGAALGVTADRYVVRDRWTREMRDPRAMRNRIAHLAGPALTDDPAVHGHADGRPDEDRREVERRREAFGSGHRPDSGVAAGEARSGSGRSPSKSPRRAKTGASSALSRIVS